MHYTFNYFTGYGIYGISAHTIKFYPIKLNADNDEQAIELCLNKTRKLSRYNECYRGGFDRIPVITKEKVGILFLKEKQIIWENSTLYHGLPCIQKAIKGQLQSFILKKAEYTSVDVHWTHSYCANGNIFISEEHWNNYCDLRTKQS